MWMDDVEFDLRNMGVKRWITRTLHGTKCTSVVREAEIEHEGL
jgi:hypothetical protein